MNLERVLECAARPTDILVARGVRLIFSSRGASAATFGDEFCAVGQIIHHRAAHLWRELRPCADFIDAAQATRTEAGFGMNDANFDTRAVDFAAFPDVVGVFINGHGAALMLRRRSNSP